MTKIRFKRAEEVRKALTAKEKKNIINIYTELSKQIEKEKNKMSRKSDFDSKLRKIYLNSIVKEINSQLKTYMANFEKSLINDMSIAANAVVDVNLSWFKSVGLEVSGAFTNVSKDIVEVIATGQLYGDGWSLSKAIWSDLEKTQQDIYNIVAAGVAGNKSTIEIATDLEKYVNPVAKKPWDWGKVYPGSKRKIDYNAQRLARTMISHAYQSSFVNTTYYNPFFDAYQWVASNSERTCQICLDRAGTDSFGLGVGVFPKDELPIDHPNGLCTFVVVTSMSHDRIVDSIADWYNGVGDEELNRKLDKFSEYVYGKD